ncbi:hypothetical protein WISP_94938 [Willisornis vidua]|uniref:Uncharacterized protein n=1 Tax=Willisornis vidua TaxID=1566151 RepID=A0ABQ9D5L2_9PASS|nr:hypothetical protein WISP_94938 [Willisornis vidua]
MPRLSSVAAWIAPGRNETGINQGGFGCLELSKSWSNVKNEDYKHTHKEIVFPCMVCIQHGGNESQHPCLKETQPFASVSSSGASRKAGTGKHPWGPALKMTVVRQAVRGGLCRELMQSSRCSEVVPAAEVDADLAVSPKLDVLEQPG